MLRNIFLFRRETCLLELVSDVESDYDYHFIYRVDCNATDKFILQT
jgi:hypothetical protein